MSLSTLIPAFDDFDDEFEAIVAGLDFTQPIGEPLPDPEPTARTVRTRPARGDDKRAAIDLELGIVRHRSREREA